MELTRRHFLARVGAAGGASLMYEAMTGLGLLAAPVQVPFELTGRASGVRVVILGGGLAGMTAAYELGKVGAFRHVAARAMEPRLMAVGIRRSAASARGAPTT